MTTVVPPELQLAAYLFPRNSELLQTELREILFSVCTIQSMNRASFVLPVLRKQFESPPYSVSVEVGQGTEIRCVPPAGVPPPRVYWLRNGATLDAPTDTLLISSEGHLLLGQAKLSHQANYSCVAENVAAKRVSDPASLTVYGELSANYGLFARRSLPRTA